MRTTTSHKTILPTSLYAAYDWTAAASELDELRTLRGRALARYCRESAANCASDGPGDVTADDVYALHVWLVEGGR